MPGVRACCNSIHPQPHERDCESKLQTLFCPKRSRASYRNYMRRHKIRFRETIDGGVFCFILPAKYRPHRWKAIKP